PPIAGASPSGTASSASMCSRIPETCVRMRSSSAGARSSRASRTASITACRSTNSQLLLQVGVAQHDLLPADALEVDDGAQVLAEAGQLADGAPPELRVAHALALHEARHVLRIAVVDVDPVGRGCVLRLARPVAERARARRRTAPPAGVVVAPQLLDLRRVAHLDEVRRNRRQERGRLADHELTAPPALTRVR